MTLSLADFAQVIECELKKIATVGHDRRDLYSCSNCKAWMTVKGRSKKPNCRVRDTMATHTKQLTNGERK